MISKLLVANRGEIAIRAFRAAFEMGISTVAVYPYEDRNSSHRLKADESYQIGETGHPVRAYLSVDEIIRVAKHAGADAVYPGYGFLSENPELAVGVRRGGHHVRRSWCPRAGADGQQGARDRRGTGGGSAGAGSSAPSASVDELVAAAASMQFPLFVKAVSGGGGRGMRRVAEPEALAEAIEAASREAESAFGDPTVYLEQAVVNPRHIEVQILADGQGNVIHLFERDCSVQRRHQKVIELAPAPNLPAELRERICADAVAFARQIDYTCAGTVEFLLDERGNHVFIEMNPRIQVEHTVTEEITDVDLVASQLRIASGETLADLGLSQDTVQVRGAAMQCRITTEDPGNGFRPDTGRITGYRSPGGAGIRLDGGTPSGRRDQRALRLDAGEVDLPGARLLNGRHAGTSRIGGVPDPRGIDQHPVPAGRGRRSRLPGGPGHHVVHRRATAPAHRAHPRRPRHEDPQLSRRGHGEHASTAAVSGCIRRTSYPTLTLRPDATPPAGSKQRLTELGPEGFAAWLRDSPAVGLTDTTFRDAHQSLLATRVRTTGLLMVAPYIARMTPELLSHRVLGRGDLRCGASVPEGRPVGAAGRAARGGAQICLQMLLRAATPSATRRTRSRSRRRSSTRPPRRASTSSASSTR